MNEIKLKSDLKVVRTYLEKKKVSHRLDYHGKGLFHTHVRDVKPKEFGKTLSEKLGTYVNFRNFFEGVISDLPHSDPFFLSYENEVDFYFDKLGKDLGLNK
ncbi:MAG: hypothetical protein NUV46_03760 [Nanoarchaeota archaeon]|nr:hypothetical protein [Nanoarchaeota archaeon]